MPTNIFFLMFIWTFHSNRTSLEYRLMMIGVNLGKRITYRHAQTQSVVMLIPDMTKLIVVRYLWFRQCPPGIVLSQL